MRFRVSALLLALTFAACEQPTQPPTEIEPSFALGPLAEQASGSWTIEGTRTFAFTARRYADGTVAGAWERVNQALDARHNGSVVCMTTIGNQVWVGTYTKTGPQAGTYGGFRAVDNGEGANAGADGLSLQFVNWPEETAYLYCDITPDTPALQDVGAGQVQVGTVSPAPPGAACNGQIVRGIASTWPWAHNDKIAFPPPPGSIALWVELFGEAVGISSVHELQLLFCGP